MYRITYVVLNLVKWVGLGWFDLTYVGLGWDILDCLYWVVLDYVALGCVSLSWVGLTPN